MEIFLFIFAFVGVALYHAGRYYGLGNVDFSDTFQGYRKQFPNNIRNGRPTCYVCDSDEFWVNVVANTRYYRIYSHTCRVCGEHLYSSRG